MTIELRIPAAAFADKALRALDLLVLGACGATASADGTVRASSREIATLLGRERRNVSHVVRRLLGLGWLAGDPGGRGRPARFSVVEIRGSQHPGAGFPAPRLEEPTATARATTPIEGATGVPSTPDPGFPAPRSGPPPITPPATPRFRSGALGAETERDPAAELRALVARFVPPEEETHG